jgi:hypothetical protein
VTSNRRRFVTATTTSAGADLARGSITPAQALEEEKREERDEDFLSLLTAEADALVPDVLDSYREALAGDISVRTVARYIRRLATAWTWQRSAHHHDTALLAPAAEMADALADLQHDDGLFDQGNLHSPPDTSFSIQDLCLVLTLLGQDDDPRAAGLRAAVTRVVRKAGPALAASGLHTPNHRWELCGALARIHVLFPDSRYPRRIDQWLAEGVDQYPDGQYSERSHTYAAVVTNPSLLTLARLTDRPELYAHVARNLTATLYQVEPNGEVVTVHSRRQDQNEQRSIAGYWLQYRELALRDGHGDRGNFAAMARDIQRRIAETPPFEDPPGDALAHVLDHPELAGLLPASEPLPTRFTHHDRDTRTVRVRRGSSTATVFGGTDLPAARAIASGLSTNPTFLTFRNGAAILDSVRLAPQFFSLGHFRSEGLEPAAGGGWRLHARERAAYHLPLPPEHRRADGLYPLTDEGRFWSAMDFPHRRREYRTLRTEILVTEAGTGFDVTFDIDESEVPLTIELAFRPGGELQGTGLEPVAGQADTYQLVSGEGTFRVGGDLITFGPGNGKGLRQPPVVDPGERYTWLRGSLTPPGPRVLITGRSPFHYRLSLR